MTSAPDPEQATKSSRPTRRRLRLFLLALLLAPLALYATRGFVLHPLLARAAELAGPRFGLDLEIGALRGDWWSTLALEDVRAEASDEAGALRSLDVRRVAVEFDLLELLAGKLAGLERIELRGASVRYDATLAAPSEPDDAPVSWPEWPQSLPAVSVKDVDAEVRLAAGELALRGLELSLAPEGDVDSLRLRAGGVSWTPVDAAPIELGLGLQARHANGVITIRSLDAGPLHVGDGATVDLTRLGERRIAWDGAVEALGGRLKSTGDLEGAALRARFDGSGFDAARVAFWWPELEPEALEGALALSGEMTLAENGTARGAARLEWTQPAWRGYELDELVVETTLDGARLGFPSAVATQGENVVRASDLTLALDAPNTAALLRGATGELRAEVRDLPRLIDHALPDIPPHELALAASLASDGLNIDSGYVETVGGRADIARGRLVWDMENDFASWLAELDARASFTDLAALGELLGEAPWSGSLEGDLRLTGTLGEPTWTADLAGSQVRIADRALGDVRIAARGDAARTSLTEFSLDGEDVRAEGAGELVHDPLALAAFELRGDLRRPGEWSSVLADYLGPTAVVAFEAELAGDVRRLTGMALVRGESLRAAGEDLGPWTLDVRANEGALDVRSSRLATPWGALDLAASCTNPFESDSGAGLDELRIDELRLAVGETDLALEEPTRITWSSGSFALEPARLRGTAGALDLELAQASEGLSVTARAVDLELLPFLEAYVPADVIFGVLNAELEIAGLGDSASFSTRGALADLTWSGAAERGWDATWAGTFATGTMSLEELTLVDGGDVGLRLAGDLPLDLEAPASLPDGPLRLEGLLDWQRIQDLVPADLAWRPSGAMLARIDLAGSWRALEGSIEVEGTGALRLPAEAAAEPGDAEPTAGEELAAAVRARIELGPDAITLRESSASLAGLGSATAEGTLAATADVASWLEAGLDAVRTAPLTLTAEVDAEELAWLAERFPVLRRTAGDARATVRVAGTLDAPELTGDLTLRRGELRTRSQLPPLTAIDADLIFDGRLLRIERCAAEMGAAPVGLEGEVDLFADPPSFDLRLTGENALMARTSTLRLRADLDLKITDTLAAPRIAGTVRLRNTRMLVDVDFVEIVQANEPAGPSGLQLFSLREPPLANATFDVRVLTEEPIALRGNLMRGELRTDLRLGGTGEVPLPTGSVFLDAFRVSLPSGTMNFDFGRVEFEPGNPFDPRLSLRGESQLYGYEVAMTVQGPLSSPELVTSSSPSLDNAELLLMALTGQVPGGGTVQQAGTNLAVYFGRSLFSRGGSLDEGDSLLDRLEVQTGREVSRGGTPTTEASLRVARGVAGENSQLLLTGEQDVYEQINMGLRLRFVLR